MIYDNPLCPGCGRHVKRMREYGYLVHDRIWKQSLQRARCHGEKVSTYDLVCIGCLEKRLGRELTSKDFNWEVPLNYAPVYPRSKRLRNRMGDRLHAAQVHQYGRR